MTEPDWNDIQASLAGDEDAYSRLVRKYQEEIARQMWTFSRDPTTCEELVQDVFVEAYFSLHRFRGDAPLLHWLHRIASRVGYKFWKTRSKRGTLLPIEEWDTPTKSDSDAVYAAERLHRILAQMAPPDRMVLTLMYFEDFSVKKIASRTGWSQAMVKMRAFRARKRLRRLLQREGWDDTWMV